MKIKTCLAVAMLVANSSIFALSLADASAKIDDVVKNPALMTSTMKELSSADQVTFLSRVNAAIESFPGSNNEKAAKFLDMNTAALKGSAKGNVTALLAEVYATVPPESLTVINEKFAETLFSRTANPNRPISDAEMTAVAKNVMKAIQERNAKSDNADIRNTFAVLMFVRASNGKPENLRDELLSQYQDEKVRETAKNEWIPPALGENRAKTYEPMLGALGSLMNIESDLVLQMAAPQTMVALLGDLNATVTGRSFTTVSMAATFNGMPNLIGDDAGLHRVPRTDNPDLPYHGKHRRGEVDTYKGTSL